MALREWHLTAVTVAVVLVHLWACPFTKVEESFNVQATHDLLFFGPSEHALTTHYDHLRFRGVVPRTFAGPLALAAVASPVVQLVQWLNAADPMPHDRLWALALVRGILGCAYAWTLCRFRKTFGDAFAGVARAASAPAKDRNALMAAATARSLQLQLWFTVVSVTQFHGMFYASRPLPNVFAAVFVNLALSAWLQQANGGSTSSSGGSTSSSGAMWCLVYLAVATFVFRCDMLLLSGALVLCSVLYGWVSVRDLLAEGVRALFMGPAAFVTVASVALDTYFWNTPHWLWPELEVFLFNLPGRSAAHAAHAAGAATAGPNAGPAAAAAAAADGVASALASRSAQWGVSPWHWYFTSALPRMLLAWSVVLIAGVLAGPRDSDAAVGTTGGGAAADAKAKSKKAEKQEKRDAKAAASVAAAAAAAGVRPETDVFRMVDWGALRLLLPAVLFVALYSGLPHKELRFILPALPLFNAVAALGAAKLQRFGHAAWASAAPSKAVLRWGLVLGAAVVSAAASGGFLYVSTWNYPGGHALVRFHDMLNAQHALFARQYSAVRGTGTGTGSGSGSSDAAAAAYVDIPALPPHPDWDDEQALLDTPLPPEHFMAPFGDAGAAAQQAEAQRQEAAQAQRRRRPRVIVHLSNLACTTGVSRFGQWPADNPILRYSKSENLVAPRQYGRYQYLIAERPLPLRWDQSPPAADDAADESDDALEPPVFAAEFAPMNDTRPYSAGTSQRVWAAEPEHAFRRVSLLGAPRGVETGPALYFHQRRPSRPVWRDAAPVLD